MANTYPLAKLEHIFHGVPQTPKIRTVKYVCKKSCPGNLQSTGRQKNLRQMCGWEAQTGACAQVGLISVPGGPRRRTLLQATFSPLWDNQAAAVHWIFHTCFDVTCIQSADQQPNTNQLGERRLSAVRRKLNRLRLRPSLQTHKGFFTTVSL